MEGYKPRIADKLLAELLEACGCVGLPYLGCLFLPLGQSSRAEGTRWCEQHFGFAQLAHQHLFRADFRRAAAESHRYLLRHEGGTAQVQGNDDGHVVLRDRHRQLPHQRHRPHLGHGYAIMDGVGRACCALPPLRRVHLLDHEAAGAGYARVLDMVSHKGQKSFNNQFENHSKSKMCWGGSDASQHFFSQFNFFFLPKQNSLYICRQESNV